MAPQRTCAGCRRTTGQDELQRIVRTTSGGLVVGRGKPGRGAWVCAGSASCLEQALKTGRLAKSLKVSVDMGSWERLSGLLAVDRSSDERTSTG